MLVIINIYIYFHILLLNIILNIIYKFPILNPLLISFIFISYFPKFPLCNYKYFYLEYYNI